MDTHYKCGYYIGRGYNSNYSVLLFPASCRFIEIEKNDQQTLEKFLNKLKNSNITNLLNLDENADPNLNFDLFMKHFMNLKQECFQKKLVRFDKKKT